MAAEEPHALEQAGLRFQVGIFEEAVANNPEDTDALRFLSHGYAALGRMEEGLGADRRLVELLPRDERVRYNLACSLSLTGKIDEAIEVFERAIELGFQDLNLVSRDPDLDPLREDPRFDALVARIRGS